MGGVTPRPGNALTLRERLTARIQRRLERSGHPRLQMTVISALTGGAGLMASFALLHLGLDNMALRYPLATLFAYGAFVLLIWIWLRGLGTSALDLLPMPSPGSTAEASPVVADIVGMGGEFGGSGASGSFAEGLAAVATDSAAGATVDAAGGAAGTATEVVADTAASVATDTAGGAVGEGLGCLPIVLIVLLGVGLLAALQLVPLAPTLLAEVAVDGALSVTLYRRMQMERRHWLPGLLRRTAWRFGAVALVLAALGYGLSLAAPEAHTLGQAVHRLVR